MSPKSEKRVKKLVSVSATSTLPTGTKKEVAETAEAGETTGAGKNGEESKDEYLNLAQVPYIRYPITFQKQFIPILVLFNLGSEVNAIYPIFAWELGLLIRPIDVRV